MAEEQKEVEEVEPSTTEDVETESSTEEPEEATSQEAAQEQVQQVPYDRFQQVNEQKNKAEQEVAYYKGLAERPQSTEAPTTDPDANLDPQTQVFYQGIDKRTQKIVDTAIAAKSQEYESTIQALASQNAAIHVVRDSPEEMEIAGLIKQGVPPDKAAWAVMGPKRVESAKVTGKNKIQNKAQQKAEANLEVAGVPANTGMPTGEKLTFRQTLDKKMRDAGQ